MLVMLTAVGETALIKHLGWKSGRVKLDLRGETIFVVHQEEIGWGYIAVLPRLVEKSGSTTEQHVRLSGKGCGLRSLNVASSGLAFAPFGLATTTHSGGAGH
mgnify:CR=1 FL=1